MRFEAAPVAIPMLAVGHFCRRCRMIASSVVARFCHSLMSGVLPFAAQGKTRQPRAGILHELSKDIGGFEGNAQTFRILHTLEKKHYGYGGLNLTRRTLLGVVKLHQKHNQGKNKKFMYDEDFSLVTKILKQFKLGKEPNTIDMQVMNLADEIAYAAHDLEDCLKLDYFTIDELLHEFKYSSEFSDTYKFLKNLVIDCQKFATKAERLSTSEEFSFLFRRRLTSSIVDTLVRDIYYPEGEKGLTLKQHKLLADGLKDLTFKAVQKKSAIHLYEKMGEKVIRGLYKVYTDTEYNKDLKLLSAEYRTFTDETGRLRTIIDFISGMMDSFAMREYEKYFGVGSLERQYFRVEDFSIMKSRPTKRVN